MLTRQNGHQPPIVESLWKEILACLPALKAFAISLAGNVDRAEDLVQETVYRAIDNIDSYTPNSNMNAWLFTILRNHFRSEYRKHKREAEWDEGYENTVDFSTGGDSLEGDTTFDLHRALEYVACLPPDQRDSLIAVGYLGLSYEEAAERLGCVVGTIKSRVNRARNELHDYLEGGWKVGEVDYAPLKHATKGMPKDHPLYPIAEAYEMLYASFKDQPQANGAASQEAPASDIDQAWEQLVASGVLDQKAVPFDRLIRDLDE